jgi:hypothetical protein
VPNVWSLTMSVEDLAPTAVPAPRTVPASQSGRAKSLLVRLLPVARPAIALLILGAVVYAVASKWSGVRSALDTLSWSHVVLSMAAAMVGTVTGMMAWRALLRDEGHPQTPAVAGRIFFVGQLGKYLPGSVWSVVLQMELGKRAGIPRGRAFTTSLAWVGLSLATGLCVGAIALPQLASSHSGEFWVLVVALPIAVTASLPPVLTRLVNLILRLSRKGPLPKPLSWTGVLTACAWLVATWFLYGVHLWLLGEGLGAHGFGGLVRCTGGFALAVAAGVVFVVAPSGAGVREVIIVAALAQVMPSGEALGIAVVSRVMFVFTDLIAAGVAAASGLRRVREPERAVTAS